MAALGLKRPGPNGVTSGTQFLCGVSRLGGFLLDVVPRELDQTRLLPQNRVAVHLEGREVVAVDVADEFSMFVRVNSASLFRTAVLLTRDRGQAEDLVQDALVHLYPNWHLVAGADAPLAYARQAMVRRFLGARRAERSGWRSVFDPHDGVDPVDWFTPIVDRDVLARLLAILTAHQRAALVLRYLCDYPDGDIAAVLGCREATVRSLVSRGLAVLKNQVRGDTSASRVHELETP